MNNLVARYFSGELSPGELNQFQEMLEKDPEMRSLVDEYRKVWESVGSSPEEPPYDLDAEWALLQEKLPGMGSSKGEGRPLLFYIYRVAAVLVAGFFLASAWFYFSRMAGVEKIVATGDPVEVLLGDGTLVTVNKGSMIRYSKGFSGSTRKVTLSGEAWFDVARDTTRPFIIDAGMAVVEVLGTSFNVNAYNENNVVEITVKSGVVALMAKQDKQEQIVLRAGNSGTYHKEEQELRLEPTSNPNKISWKTRELFFDNAPLKEVVDLVGDVYNVHISIKEQSVASCPITVAFIDQSLDAVLRVLGQTLDLDITREGNEILINGTGCEE